MSNIGFHLILPSEPCGLLGARRQQELLVPAIVLQCRSQLTLLLATAIGTRHSSTAAGTEVQVHPVALQHGRGADCVCWVVW
jgi:hypothetical protein